MKRGLAEIVVLGFGLLVVIGVPAWFIREGLVWIGEQYGPDAAMLAFGGGIILLAFVGGGMFTHRIKQKTQADMLDALEQMGAVVSSMAGVHKANAQGVLIEQRQAAEAERRFNMLVDQRVKMLTAGQAPAASVPSWFVDLEAETVAAPAGQAAGGRGGVRHVE